MLKLCMSNIAWSREKNQEFYQLLQDYGFSGLEIAPFVAFEKGIYANEEDIQSFLEDVKGYELTPVSIQSLLFGIPREMAVFEGNEKRAELAKTLEETIQFASKIGASNLVFGSPKNRCLTSETEYQEGVHLFKHLGDYAASLGVILAIEPNAKAYGTNFATTLAEAIAFIETVQSPGVRLNFDFGSFIMENESDESFIKAIPYMNHVHISAPMLEHIETLDKSRLMACLMYLKKSYYSGFISIEMKQAANSNQESVERALEYLNQIVDEIGY